MSDTKINNKHICGDDDFRVTTNDPSNSDEYYALTHDSDNVIAEIGSGSKIINHLDPIILIDDDYFDLPAGSAGYGFLFCGYTGDYASFHWAEDNTVTLMENSTYVDDADTDDYLCIFDNTSAVRIRNRLGAPIRVLFEYHYTLVPLAPTFRAFAELSGVDNLDPNLTINGTTNEPLVRFKGDSDAEESNWYTWDYGSNYMYGSSGYGGTFNQGSPGLGENDDSVRLNGTQYWSSITTSLADISTEDIVIELVFRWSTTDGKGVLSKWDREYHASGGEGGGGPYYSYTGYGILEDSDGLKFLINDNVETSAAVTSAALTDDCFYHAILFVDRSGSGQWYINGTASGSAGDVSSMAATISNAEEFYIGRCVYFDTGVPDINIAYLAIWADDAWLDTHLQATVAAERFAKFAGYYPQVANGTYTPTTATRTYPAYIDKIDSDGIRKLYYVGDEWLRMCHRQDSSGNHVMGYLPETEIENLITYSEDFNGNWSQDDAGDTVADAAAVCPDGRIAAASLVADSDEGLHGIYSSITLTAASYAFSVFAKPGDANLIALTTSIANCWCYFNISNGTVGTSGVAATGYIEGPFYSGDDTPFYRCCIVYTGTAAAYNHRIRSFKAEGSNFAGDGLTVNTYIWGAQVEANDYMSSPIRTSGSALTRVKDHLQFVAGDNIGGEDVGEGTVVFDCLFSDYDSQGSNYAFSISDGGSSSDRIWLSLPGYNNSDYPYLWSDASGGNSGLTWTPVVPDVSNNVKHEIRSCWETDNLIMYVDGSGTIPDTDCAMPDDLDTIDFCTNSTHVGQINGLIQNFRIYNTPTTKG